MESQKARESPLQKPRRKIIKEGVLRGDNYSSAEIIMIDRHNVIPVIKTKDGSHSNGGKTGQTMADNTEILDQEVESLVSLPLNNMPPLNSVWMENLLVPEENLRLVNPAIKKLFSNKIKTNLPLAGRLQHFQNSWRLITKDPEILSFVKGYKIPLLEKPVQNALPQALKMSKEQRDLVELEIQTMLRKGAISRVQHIQGEFLSNLFLVEKKDGGNVQ